MRELHRRAYLSLLALAVLVTAAVTCVALRREPTRALPARSDAIEAAEADPLTRFRTEREQLRQRQRGELNDIAHGVQSDPEAAALAQRRLIELMSTEETELKLEGILCARGFEEVLVSLSAQSANVLVRRDSALTRRETAIILDLVTRETGLTGGNVRIIPIN